MYNKLFTKILDSSIWLAPDPHRLVWITVLAAMNDDGIVQFASVANLAHRARVDIEHAQNAIDAFEGPDPHSGDPDNDGRRLERIPGGWLVLNAYKYRALVTRAIAKESTRQRVSEYRNRVKSGFADKFKEQNGLCGCCSEPFKEPFNLYVVQDHDHKTGAIRDLLCQSCNKNVGQFENGKLILTGKTDICRAYVEKHTSVTTCNTSVTPSEADTDTDTEADSKKTSMSVSPTVLALFEHWKQAHGHPKAQLDAKRRKVIQLALKTYSPADLHECISGYLNSPHHMGLNDRHTKYDDIEIFLRDAKHIDTGIAFHRHPPRTDLSKLTKKNVSATETWTPPEVRHATK